MTPDTNPLKLAPRHAESEKPLFKDDDDLEGFWSDLYSKVTPSLEKWDRARAQSEEEARNLWIT